MRKSKQQEEAELAMFLTRQRENSGSGAIPIGSAIIRPNARGVVGVKPRQDDPKPNPS